MADEDGQDPGRDFAALMSGAAQAAAPADVEAPYGFTIDRETGEHRPKKTAGRPRKPPGLDDLKAAKAESETSGPAAPAPEDRAPSKGKRTRRAGRTAGAPKDDAPVPQHRPGQITKGVNRLYRRAGKIVRAMDRDIGVAILESARDDDEESVGAAWEELARTNPRIRAFLLRCIGGGAWGALIMAHMPIFLAIVMKDGIRKHVPFMKLIESMAEPDETATDQEKSEALNPDDLKSMMGMAQQMMASMGGRVAPPGAASERSAA